MERATLNGRTKIDCRPFLKWVGGKSQLKSELTSRLPHDFNRYFEPFLGGGALFFALQPGRAFLSDINQDLVNTYRVVRDNIDELIEDLHKHIYEKEYYLRLRNMDREEEFSRWSDIHKASRFIYLNRSCFNGLYRVNSRGYFNVPFGRYTNPTLVDEPNLRACSRALADCEIGLDSFAAIEDRAGEDDFVYFDPPYVPLNPTSNFTAYTRSGFDEDMQVELKDLCDRLTVKGVKFMLSNSSAPLILDLYAGYNLEIIQANRAINSKPDKRGKIPEVIVRNFNTSS